MNKTTIIAGFPGVGKSFLKNEFGESVSDSDSSTFPKDKFPQNYINHIKSLIGKKRLIMVSTHKEVLEALEDNDIEYILTHPERGLKDEYLKRYEERGSPKGFVDLLDNKWDDFMSDIRDTKPKRRIVLKAGEFLKDRLNG
tara:strand:- start:413 stop:835 length:423 start_codon:yes stop_codon:yes gene_type:complete